jgi:hypothetical protein
MLRIGRDEDRPWKVSEEKLPARRNDGSQYFRRGSTWLLANAVPCVFCVWLKIG